jgi:hypothetical protein
MADVENELKVQFERLKRKGHLGDLASDWRVTLKQCAVTHLTAYYRLRLRRPNTFLHRPLTAR